MGFTPSSCVKRSTRYLTIDAGDYRVSSTIGSAVVDQPISSGTKSFAADLTLMADAPRVEIVDPRSDVVFTTRAAKLTGTFGGAKVRADSGGGGSWISRAYHGDN